MIVLKKKLMFFQCHLVAQRYFHIFFFNLAKNMFGNQKCQCYDKVIWIFLIHVSIFLLLLMYQKILITKKGLWRHITNMMSVCLSVCPLGRCDKTGRSLIYSVTLYFPCVTPTKRSVVLEMF